MKKLMFAAAAALCATVGMAVESNNIVGYREVSSSSYKNPTMGTVFVPVNGDSSVKLGTLKMVAVEDPEDFMDVEGEFIQLLNTDGAGVTDDKFTYFSKEYVDAVYEDPDEHEEMMAYVGWWQYADGEWYIGEEGYNRNSFDVEVGQAFLGELNPYHTLKFTAAGQVPTESTYASSKSYKNPYLCNYLPVDVPLKNVTVTAVEDPEDFMDVEGEFIQLLNTDGAGVTDDKFTYFSKEYVDAVYEDPAEHEEMMAYVGWWLYADGEWYIGEPGYERGEWVWKAGTGLLGELNPYHTLNFNFPSTLDVK